MNTGREMNSDQDLLAKKTKIDVLQNAYSEVRSHIRLLHRNSIGLALVVIPLLVWVANNSSVNSDTPLFIVLSPLIMTAIFGGLIYIRTASNIYMDSCRSIEKKINRLVGDDSLFDFESGQRACFDKVCFSRWGPGRIMYTLIGTMFALLYVYMCVTSCMVLIYRFSSSAPKWAIVAIASLVYLLPFAMLCVAAYKTIKLWMDKIGRQALNE